MWELDQKEGWAPKNWFFQIMVLEKTLENSLDCKEIKSVNLKGNQPWLFIGKTDAEAEAPIPWPLDAKSWLIGKDSDGRKDWGQEEKRVTEDEMVGCHHRLNGHEFEQTPGDSEVQERLPCCSPWYHKQSNTTEQQPVSGTLSFVKCRWVYWCEGNWKKLPMVRKNCYRVKQRDFSSRHFRERRWQAKIREVTIGWGLRKWLRPIELRQESSWQ